LYIIKEDGTEEDLCNICYAEALSSMRATFDPEEDTQVDIKRIYLPIPKGAEGSWPKPDKSDCLSEKYIEKIVPGDYDGM
jgi:hypothetical protein